MKKSTENSNNTPFLKENFKGDISKNHKVYLGASIPEGYFEKSKLLILDKIKEEESKKELPKKQVVFYMQTQFKYVAAASLFFVLCLTVWLQSANNNEEQDYNLEAISYQEEVLINSLFVDDADLDLFAEKTLINEIVIKAELSEQQVDNLILDVMVLDDTLSDNKFIESLIL